MSGQEPRREHGWGRAQFDKTGTASSLALSQPTQSSHGPILGQKDKVSHPVLALTLAMGLGLVSPSP